MFAIVFTFYCKWSTASLHNLGSISNERTDGRSSVQHDQIHLQQPLADRAEIFSQPRASKFNIILLIYNFPASQRISLSLRIAIFEHQKAEQQHKPNHLEHVVCGNR